MRIDFINQTLTRMKYAKTPESSFEAMFFAASNQELS